MRRIKSASMPVPCLDRKLRAKPPGADYDVLVVVGCSPPGCGPSTRHAKQLAINAAASIALPAKGQLSRVSMHRAPWLSSEPQSRRPVSLGAVQALYKPPG